jgi:hypothetical protein
VGTALFDWFLFKKNGVNFMNLVGNLCTFLGNYIIDYICFFQRPCTCILNPNKKRERSGLLCAGLSGVRTHKLVEGPADVFPL